MYNATIDFLLETTQKGQSFESLIYSCKMLWQKRTQKINPDDIPYLLDITDAFVEHMAFNATITYTPAVPTTLEEYHSRQEPIDIGLQHNEAAYFLENYLSIIIKEQLSKNNTSSSNKLSLMQRLFGKKS